MNRSYTLLLMIAGLTFTSCGDKADGDREDLIDSTDTVKTTVLNIGGELFSIPSPIQTAMLVQKSGIPYDKAVLSPSNKQSTYSTDYLRALALGIYGADLGYVSLYNQNQDALGYLASIKQLSDKLGISAAFDKSTMERIRDNITNKDSMMVLVGLVYRASDAYLKDNQRSDVSSLILAGGWIESMHFSHAAYTSKPSDQIKFRIAEQKQALNSLVKILNTNPSEEGRQLAASLGELAKVYEGITFKYQFVEPTTDSVKRITYINSTTEVTVSDDQIRQIGSLISGIRNKIVNITQS